MAIYQILNNGEQENIINANEAFVKEYCKDNGFTYKLIGSLQTFPDEQEVLDPISNLELMTLDQEYRLTLLELGMIQ